MSKISANLSEEQKEILKVFDNRCLVFEEIVEKTGFTKVKVGRVLDEMIEMGLIEEKVN